MTRPEMRLLASDPLAVAPTGTWIAWTPGEAEARPDLVEAVRRFEPIDKPGGLAAAEWLRESALGNDGSTKTHVVVDEGEVQGFFSCCAGTVRIREEESASLLVPHRRDLPAFLVAWVARRRGGTVPGEHLMLAAYGLARDIARSVGMVAFALDPMDEDVSRVWEAAPYGFRRCVAKRGDKTPRLWLPL